MGVLKRKCEGRTLVCRLDRESLVLGSGPQCHLRLSGEGLAERHCVIVRAGKDYLVRNLSPSGATFVNDQKVKERLLKDRDVIRIGKERFTFYETDGDVTSRVSASIHASSGRADRGLTDRASVDSPPSASSVPGRATARLVKAPGTPSLPSTPTTARVAKVPETSGTARSGRITARVERAGEGSSGKPGSPSVGNGTSSGKKTTERFERGTATHRVTGRAAVAFPTSRSFFALPATMKGKLVAAGAILGILGLAGIMWAVKASKVDPEEVKKILKKEIESLNKIPKDDFIERDLRFEKILADPQYAKYGGAVRKTVDREHPKVHEAAETQKAADREVKPFLGKVQQAKESPERYDAKAEELYDEARSLGDKYNGTNHGAKLIELKEELKKYLENRKTDSWETSYPRMTVDVQKEKEKGDCVAAMALVDGFGEKYKQKDNPPLSEKLKDLRDSIRRHADAHVEKLHREAQKLLDDGKKDEARKLLEAARPGLAGFPAAEKLKSYIGELK